MSQEEPQRRFGGRERPPDWLWPPPKKKKNIKNVG